jgi:predicted ATPase
MRLQMPEFPSGTVTFLFTDIEGSTRLLHELGDGYADALAEHRRVLRSAFSEHHGVEVDTQGDAFFGAFARASDAVAAATAIQRGLAPGPIRVRIGLHTGEPLRTDEGYVGLDVHRGARICAAGHGGQVLLSQPTRDLVDADARDLGEHRLKDLLEPQRLFQLGVEDFPPLKTLNWTNLPVQATPLVGREQELTEAMALLREQRLLTLVGPPGTGKTRLALQLAAEVADDFEHIWWVALEQVREPDLVEATIAQTIGARDDLVGYLRDRRALLLLDNVEQVLGYAARVAELVAASTNLKVVATSREPLRLAGEQQYPVPPLPENDARTLFSERARSVRPGFAANGAVAEICRRLDGLPLAIELAAARVKMLPPDALLARLDQRLPLLTGGARDAPERQQTLRATISWSYDLLDEHEQELLASLSVFAGGWTLEAAEAVCDCELETLASLVDKSLVRERDGRFSMLETIREYAHERLIEQDAAGVAHQLHAEYFLERAEANCAAFPDELSRDQVDWFGREHDNLRAALDWLRQQEAELELRLVVACYEFWKRSGYWTEGRQRKEAALERGGEAPALLRARALRQLSDVVSRQGDYARGKKLAEAALMLHQELGTNGPETLHAHITLAISEHKLGNRERALELFDAVRATGDERSRATTLNNLGNMALDEHDHARARSHFEESAAINRRLRQQVPLANNLLDLGFVALADARAEDAAPAFRESLGICRAERLDDLLIWVVEGVAAVALGRGAPVVAASLLAATTRPRADLALGADFYPIAEEVRERTLDAARESLGEAAFAAAWAEGEALSLEEAAEKAALVD